MKNPSDNWEELRRKVLGLGDSSVHKTHYPSLRRRLVELERLRSELQRSEAYLSDAERVSHTGSFGWKVSTGELYWSDETFQILQYARTTKPTVELVLQRTHPEDAAFVKQTIERAAQDGKDLDFAHRLLMPDGSVKHVHVVGHPQTDKSSELLEFIGAVIDVTAEKRAEETLRESEQRFRLVANTAPVMIWMTGPDTHCTFLNQTWLDFTGRSAEPKLDRGWAAGVHPEDLQRGLHTYTEAFDRRQPFKMEYRLRRYDGEYRWVLEVGVPRYVDGSFAGYIGSVVDITDHKRAEEALATVSGRLIEAHEEERRRIARELHDDIGQRLALSAVELQRFADNPPESRAELRDRAQELLRRTEEIASDVQALSHQLHSSKLEMLGIVAAAQSFCRELSAQQGVKVDFTHGNVPSALPRDVSLCLFRVLQEALQNAVKYSGTRQFRAELRRISDELELTVSDSGVGFDLREAMHSRGLGLVSMHERVSLVNGTLSITSKPESGTEISVRVPLSAGTQTERAKLAGA
jgi:PAS domain S-box-containing protein